jgi:hypothetical protein
LNWSKLPSLIWKCQNEEYWLENPVLENLDLPSSCLDFFLWFIFKEPIRMLCYYFSTFLAFQCQSYNLPCWHYRWSSLGILNDHSICFTFRRRGYA